jgi:predicted nucleotide-binding protein
VDDEGDWVIEYVDGQQYHIVNMLNYDARWVEIKADHFTDASTPGTANFEASLGVVAADERISVQLRYSSQYTTPSSLYSKLKISWIDPADQRHNVSYELPIRLRPDLRSPVPAGFASAAGRLAARNAGRPATQNADTPESERQPQYAEAVPEANPKNVFVVVGRNTEASDAMFSFLGALGLNPIEWGTAVRETGSGSPYIGQVLEVGFQMAQAVVVLMTPDDVASLRPEYASGPDDPELEPQGQARPNVLFEAGMAFGLHPKRTILVELGKLRPFTDVGGMHTVRLDNEFASRNELANRLETAGCQVVRSGSLWTRVDFKPPKVPGGPRGRRLPSSSAPAPRNHLDARFLHRSSGSDRLQLINIGAEDVRQLKSPNVKDFKGRIDGFPVPRLPAGKSINLTVMQVWGSPRTFDLIVEGHTGSGEEFSESLFVDLNG